MIIATLKEILPGENRVALTPPSVKDLIKAGLTVRIESGSGIESNFADKDYEDAGATITNASDIYQNADIIVKVATPTLDEIDQMKSGSIFTSFFQTTKELEAVKAMTDKKVTGFSMHLIPRTTLAQKMDALSSQANIAGYKAVLIGADHIGVYMPLLMTAAGTIPPAKVLILGAGVAGLQAIATAKRLGAQVEAFDVRPEVKEQVESLGAKFVEVEASEDDGVGEGGYAKETSDDYKQRQQTLITEKIAKADLVITTALIPGRPAPILIPTPMVDGMKPGSAIMDLAAENGGNCEKTEPGKIVNYNGVTIDGTTNFPGTMPIHASQLYSKNVVSFMTYMIKEGELNLDMEDEIISGSMFTHEGAVTHEPTQQKLNA
ncbi:MAG: Re/Si-specific NAD(P)(+) transhydrogenase subunit alpha [Candidatus Marinimicrobia bacterium]|nr:Re/Si-specific NAD(P)(+) transhydrogenase subunit alpha [Candidatus Neomarinimicrobiota bacterium]